MASAEDLPRPAPLPLASAAPVVDLTSREGDADATMLGAALGGLAKMEPLDHGAFLAAREFDQACRVRTGDAQGVDQLFLFEL